MIAITTSNSIGVNPRDGARRATRRPGTRRVLAVSLDLPLDAMGTLPLRFRPASCS